MPQKDEEAPKRRGRGRQDPQEEEDVSGDGGRKKTI